MRVSLSGPVVIDRWFMVGTDEVFGYYIPGLDSVSLWRYYIRMLIAGNS